MNLLTEKIMLLINR